MKTSKLEANRSFPAMIVYTVPENQGDVQTVIFLRDEPTDRPDDDRHFQNKQNPYSRMNTGLLPA